MNRLILIVLAIATAVACSKTEPAATTVAASGDAKPVDYEKICGRLIELAPAERKGSFTTECVRNYKAYLPACSNADAVNQCFANLKSWADRLACIDSCTGNPMLARSAAATSANPAAAAAPSVPAAPTPAK